MNQKQKTTAYAVKIESHLSKLSQSPTPQEFAALATTCEELAMEFAVVSSVLFPV